jgi:hypothetical protein
MKPIMRRSRFAEPARGTRDIQNYLGFPLWEKTPRYPISSGKGR